jgi:hypothetical protein
METDGLSQLMRRMGPPREVSIHGPDATVSFDQGIAKVDLVSHTDMMLICHVIVENSTILTVIIEDTDIQGEAWSLLISALSRSAITTLKVIRSSGGTMCADLAKLIQTHRRLRALTIDIEADGVLCDAVAQSTRLRFLGISDKSAKVGHILQTNRHLSKINVVSIKDMRLKRPWYTRMVCNNWALENFEFNGRPEFDCARFRIRNCHSVISGYAIALLPMRLPTYVVLWILDWLPPMSTRFEWQGDPAHDPFHGKKIALIEGLTKSYRQLNHA